MSSSSDPIGSRSQAAQKPPPPYYYLFDAKGRHRCTLCKRKLPTYEKALEHFRASRLHIENLEAKKKRDAEKKERGEQRERERAEEMERKRRTGQIVDGAVGPGPGSPGMAPVAATAAAAAAAAADTSTSTSTCTDSGAMVATTAFTTGTSQPVRKRKSDFDGYSPPSSSPSRSKSISPTKKSRNRTKTGSSSPVKVAERAATTLGLDLPSKPKNPVMSPFIFYAKDNRDAFVSSHGADMSHHDISRALGAAWRELPEDEKKPYRERVRLSADTFAVATKHYSVAMEEFKAANPEWQIENDRLQQQQEDERVASAASAAIEIYRAMDTPRPREIDAVKAANPGWMGEYDRLGMESRRGTVATQEEPRVAATSAPGTERGVEVLSPPSTTLSASRANKDDASETKRASKKNRRKMLYIQPEDEWSTSSSDDVAEEGASRVPVAYAMNTEGSSVLMQSLKDGTKRLDPYHVGVLKSVEIVLASKDDVAHKRSWRSCYREGSVGFRCIHCKHLPRSAQANGALGFPSTISNLSGNFSNFIPHFKVCSQIGDALRSRLVSKQRQVSPLLVPFSSYCTEAAKCLGIEQDPGGSIKFSDSIPRGQEPTSFLLFGSSGHGSTSTLQRNDLPTAFRSTTGTSPSDGDTSEDLICVHCSKQFTTSNGLKYHLQHAVCQRIRTDGQKVGRPSTSAAAKSAGEYTCNPDDDVEATTAMHRNASSSTSLVNASEKNQTTDFMFQILNQYVPCIMTRNDQEVPGRGHLPIGYPGMKCKHCSTTFFYGPDTRFASRITDKLYPHLKECSCPSSIKQRLARAESARELQKQERNLRGDRSPNNFATQVFERLFRQQGTESNAVATNEDGRVSVSSSGGLAEADLPQPELPRHRLMMSGGPFSSTTLPDTPMIDAGLALDNASATIFDQEMATANARSDDLFHASDRHTVTDFNYLVIRQFYLCHRSTVESKSRYPIGFPGLCCVHCNKRMYFPDSESMMKQFGQKLHKHLNDSCPGCSRDLKFAIAYAERNRESQKKQLGTSGSLTKFCDLVFGKMLRDASMVPLPKMVLGPRSSSSGVAAAASVWQMKQNEMSTCRKSSDDEGCEDSNLSSADQDAIKRVIEEAHDLPCAYISKKDRTLTSDYIYIVLKQFDICKLTEEDRIANREKYQVGFPGFKCRHCPKTFYFRDADLFGKLLNQNLGAHLKCCVSASESSDLQVALSHFKNSHSRQVRRAALSGGDFYRLIYGRLCKAAGMNAPMELLTPSPRSRSRSMRDRSAFIGSRASRRAGPLFNDSSEEDENDNNVASMPVDPLITTKDRELATDYHYMLLSQYGTAPLSRKDKRKGGCFANISVGQPGLLCRHCKAQKFFFRSEVGFKSRVFSKTKDHIRSCPSVPEAVRQRLLNWDWPQVQRQLRTVEGGSQSRLIQRLWMRLNHDWSRTREISSRPLFQEDSDVDLFCSSSDESSDVEDGRVRAGFSSTTSFSSSSGSSDDDDDTSDSEVPPPAVACQAPTKPSSSDHFNLQTTGTSDFTLDNNESERNPWVPGTVTSDLTCYTTLAWEPIAAVADKLGCGWRSVAEANRGRYSSLNNPHRATFEEGTVLKIPSDDCDISLLVQLCRKSDAVLSTAKSDGSEPTATGPSADAQHAPPGEGKDVNGSPTSKGTAVNAISDISFDKFVTCAIGMTNDFRLDLGMFVDIKFRAIVRALVGNGEEGRNESLVSLLTDGVHDAALGKTGMLYDGPLTSSAFEDSQTNTDALVEALAVFSRSRGGIFNLVENRHFIAYAESAAPHCELPKALEVMLCW